MAELMRVMDSDQWKNPSRSTDNIQGFSQYTVVHGRPAGTSTWQYAVKHLPQDTESGQHEEAHPEVVTLHGARTNPLSHVRNCDLILDKTDAGTTIVGINVDGDCVVRKT